MARRKSSGTEKGPVATTTPSPLSSSVSREVHPTSFLPPTGVPEIIIDGVAGVSVVNGIAKFRCFSAGINPENPAEVTIVLSLTMAAPVVVGLHDLFGRIIGDLRTSNLLPALPSKDYE
jgi:hypothetical protein